MKRHRLWPAFLLAIPACIGCAHDPSPSPPARTTVVTLGPPRPAPRRTAPEARSPAPPEPAARDAAIYFDFDSALLRDDARSSLQTVAAGFLKLANQSLVIEGNCDELGTVEYNLALGDARARSARDYLSRLGVPADRIHTVSYGAQHPKFPGHDEASRAKNRRDDLRVQ